MLLHFQIVREFKCPANVKEREIDAAGDGTGWFLFFQQRSVT